MLTEITEIVELIVTKKLGNLNFKSATNINNE